MNKHIVSKWVTLVNVLLRSVTQILRRYLMNSLTTHECLYAKCRRVIFYLDRVLLEAHCNTWSNFGMSSIVHTKEYIKVMLPLSFIKCIDEFHNLQSMRASSLDKIHFHIEMCNKLHHITLLHFSCIQSVNSYNVLAINTPYWPKSLFPCTWYF